MRLEDRVLDGSISTAVNILSAIGSMPRWRLQEEAVSASLYQLLEPPGIRLGMTSASAPRISRWNPPKPI